MAAYATYKNLEKPDASELYNINVANKNNDIIDSELHKLELKSQSQDNLFATKESLNEHILSKIIHTGLQNHNSVSVMSIIHQILINQYLRHNRMLLMLHWHNPIIIQMLNSQI